MIKTLRVTSVLAVILAAVVLAAVFGFRQPASFLALRMRAGGDKQIENTLQGPSAVERFKTQYRNKGPTGDDTTPPLIKQAESLAKIINPPEPSDTGVKPPINLPPTPKPGPKPLGPMSTKFALLATSCCSSNPKFSYAHIRLPDNTVQWVGIGEEIGHVTIKEIHKDSIVCWDGKTDSTVPIEAIPETSSLLETGKAANAVSAPTAESSGARPEPAATTVQPTKAKSVKPSTLMKSPGITPKASTSSVAKPSSSVATPPSSAANPSTTPSQPTAPVTGVPSAQITKQEQEKLNRLGDRLKNAAELDAAGMTETANRLINEHKSTQSLPPGVRDLADSAADPGPEPLKNTLSEEARRRYYSGRLTPPRAAKE